MRTQSHPSTPRPPHPFRGAFSLVELIIVILIIAILMSILIPAIQSARSSAVTATVVSDIKNLEKAIADFKLKYGVEPPSAFRFREDNTTWNTSNALDRNSLAVMRRIWPNFNPTAAPTDAVLERDINGDGDADDTITMVGAECLAFFLGGVFETDVIDRNGAVKSGKSAGDPVTQWTPIGFSTNPTAPFFRGGSRVGPFFDYDLSRFVNIANVDQRMPELLDPIPDQTNPYQYFSSYDARGYVTGGGTETMGGFVVPYLTSDTVGLNNGTPNGTFWNAQSYQIISPGMDREYGRGGWYEKNRGLAVSSDNNDNNRFRDYRLYERDNVTNFSGGTLGNNTFVPTGW